MSFSASTWLWLLAALPPLLLLEWRAARGAEAALRRLVGERADHVLLSQRRPGERRIGLALRTAALALLALGAAGPEWGRQVVRRSATGSDVVMLIDVSASMDARDVPPSRIEEARREALAVLDRLQGSRVGVVAFAGDAIRLCPLTLDRGAVRLVLESVTTSAVSQPGTDLGRGLRMAMRVLPGGRRSEQVIVLWTDGEDLERGASSAIDDLSRAGFRVLVVGVGTPSGDVVPELDDQGRAVDVKRDESGAAVRSRLDESLLRNLARRTRGAFFSASRPGGELPRLVGALGAVSRGTRGSRLVEQPVPRFPWFAAAAALLLAIEVSRTRRRRAAAEDRDAPVRDDERVTAGAVDAREPRGPRSRKGKGSAATAAVLLGGFLVVSQARAQSDWARGDRAFRNQRYAEAESLYTRRALHGAPPALQVNLATARALAGKGGAAESLLTSLIPAAGPAGRTAAYNAGTLQAKRSAFDDALKTLRRGLELDPDDPDARYNFELALRRKAQQRRSGSPPPTPSPSQPTPQSAGQQPTAGSAAQNPPPQAPQSPQGNPPEARQSPPPGSMDRRTAEQLLGSLSELERLEQQRLRKVRVVRERRGRDW
jgi:Ca-activated chloride channel family protein